MSDKKFVLALGYTFLTPLYDGVVRWTTREKTYKGKLIARATFAKSESVLDVGCGTGTLLRMASASQLQAKFFGLDADPAMLSVAAKKVGMAVELKQGYSTKLPFPDESFDCVISSLFFHHLSNEAKGSSLHEIFRVLKKGGRLVIADWGKPSSLGMRLLFYHIQILDGFKNTQSHIEDRFVEFMGQQGFAGSTDVERIPTVFGSLSIYHAIKPGP